MRTKLISPPAQKRRNSLIDLLRLCFMLLVMCFHTGKTCKGGFIGVEFFFLVSGVLMATSMSRLNDVPADLGKETMSFMKRKIAGIFPYYAVAWTLSFIATAVVGGYSLNRLGHELAISPYNFLMVEMMGFFDLGHRVRGSWYISAMMLSMLIIYPIRRSNRSVFDCVVAPILFLFFIGLCYQDGGSTNRMVVNYDKAIHVYGGLLRGLAEISIGCTGYGIAKWISKRSWTLPGISVLTMVELFGYLYAAVFALGKAQKPDSLVIVFWLLLSISITFSGKSFTAKALSGMQFSRVGKFSLMLYLVHELIHTQVMKQPVFATLDNATYLAVFLGLSFVAALLVEVIGNALVAHSGRLYSLFVTEEDKY